MFKLHPSRRSILRLGASAIAASALGLTTRPQPARAASKPKRIIFCVTMHGFVHDALQMIPPGRSPGDAFELELEGASLSPILSPLAPFADKLLVLDGLSMNSAIGDYWNAKNPHVPGHIHLLTGANTEQTDADGAGGGPSVDQIIASAIGNEVPFRSVEVGLGTGMDSGLGLGAYNWTGASQALPYEYEPGLLFDYLFGGFSSGSPEPKGLTGLRQRVAAFARDEHTELLSRHGGASAERLSQHRDLLAELADRFGALSNLSCAPPTRPLDGPSYAQRYADHGSVITAAFACDLTRVATIAFETQDAADCGGEGDLHVSYAHKTTDRGNPTGDPAADAVMTQAAVNHAGHMAALLSSLEAVKEDDGSSLLDHTIVVWTSELACGPHQGARAYSDLPVIIAGGGDGFRLGRYVSFAESHAPPVSAAQQVPDAVGPSHNQLLVSLCQAMGLDDVDKVGVESIELQDGSTLDCTGPLAGLT